MKEQEIEAPSVASCAFCGTKIVYGQSVCIACRSKYGINAADQSHDGCGCDA